VYRFLFSPAWLGRLAVALVLAAVMVLLGLWQLDRYEQRSAINERIDRAATTEPAPLAALVPPPAAGDAVGPAPPTSHQWALATATGRYDREHEILVRNRTLDGQVGVEVVTPLVLPDGTAVLVSRGWLAADPAVVPPRSAVPAAPTGEVTVTGWVRPGDRSAPVEVADGGLHTRRIGVEALAAHLPYPLYHGYLQLTSQDPPADPALRTVPPRRENTWMNAGYAAQWWIFATLVLIGFGWLARRHARGEGGRGGGAPGGDTGGRPPLIPARPAAG